MSYSLMVVLFMMTALTITIFIFTWRKRTRITCMTGMMIAMTVAMLNGLLAGVIIGIIFQSNIFLSTIISMIVGISIGLLAGIPISIMAVIDGMLSGMMSGMMGAMLGEMVQANYWDAIIKVFLVFFIGLMIILLYFIQNETIRNGEIHRVSFIRNPLLMTVIFLMFFFLFSKMGPIVIEGKDYNSHKHGFNVKVTKEIT